MLEIKSQHLTRVGPYIAIYGYYVRDTDILPHANLDLIEERKYIFIIIWSINSSIPFGIMYVYCFVNVQFFSFDTGTYLIFLFFIIPNSTYLLKNLLM